MNRTIVLLIIFLGTCSGGFAQIKFEMQPELGVNCSGSPYLNRKFKPVVSPLLGCWTKLSIGQRFSFNAGVQYLKVGIKYYEQRNRVNEYHDYTSEQWKNISFQKISVPLTIGYQFKIRETQTTVYFGIKRNYLLNGEIEERSKFTDRNDPDRSSDNTYRDDPFAEGPYLSPVSRKNRGVFIGGSANLGKKINVNLNYSMGQNLFYARGCFGYSYTVNDLSVSLRYTLFSI